MFFLHILILYHLLEEVIFTLYYFYTTTILVFAMPITAGIIRKTVRIKIGMRYFTTAFEKRIDDYISFLLGSIWQYSASMTSGSW